MKNTPFMLSMTRIVTASLLMVGIIAGIGMIEQMDAKRRTLILDQQAQVLNGAKVEQPVRGVLQGLAAPQVLEEPGVVEEVAVLLQQ
jgi:hypothetical protein